MMTISRNEAGTVYVGTIGGRQPKPYFWLRERYNGAQAELWSAETTSEMILSNYIAKEAQKDAAKVINEEVGPFKLDKWGLDLRMPAPW